MNTDLLYTSGDTICAISTPAGSGGVAMARVSGRDAIAIVDRLWHGKALAQAASHTAHLGNIIDPADGSVLDTAVATVFRAPASYTGENTVELTVHGSTWIQRRLIELLNDAGARLALPGEYTRRAFLNGRLDLVEAEAVADLIAASSKAAHRIAVSQMRGHFSRHLGSIRDQLIELASLLELELDFSEEDVEFASHRRLRDMAIDTADHLSHLADGFRAGAAIKDGYPVAIIGRTNVGKSSLLNTLVGDDRAIVSNIHGTTRDIIEDTCLIGPYLIRLKDTAGLRDSDDPIENLGIERSRHAADTASIVLYVVDGSEKADAQTTAELAKLDPERTIIVANKSDLPAAFQADGLPDVIAVSALTGQGIDRLRSAIADRITAALAEGSQGDIIITNERHAAALAAAAASLRDTATAIDNLIPTDLVAQHLRQAIASLEEITGQITPDTILSTIFSRFCVGK